MYALNVSLEIGKKRTFATAVDWPGWSRAGKDEQTALEALYNCGPRYAQVVRLGGIPFQPPSALSDFSVTERMPGNAETDFGAPNLTLSSDVEPIQEDELARFQSILSSCWKAFDTAAQAAAGKELRKGPRGGGRDLDRIIEHVLMADSAYLSRLAWKKPKTLSESPDERLHQTRAMISEALESAVRNGLPEKGPRGGEIWMPRYFVRRIAWHTLDHVWEIEDRIIAPE